MAQHHAGTVLTITLHFLGCLAAAGRQHIAAERLCGNSMNMRSLPTLLAAITHIWHVWAIWTLSPLRGLEMKQPYHGNWGCLESRPERQL